MCIFLEVNFSLWLILITIIRDITMLPLQEPVHQLYFLIEIFQIIFFSSSERTASTFDWRYSAINVIFVSCMAVNLCRSWNCLVVTGKKIPFFVCFSKEKYWFIPRTAPTPVKSSMRIITKHNIFWTRHNENLFFYVVMVKINLRWFWITFLT